MKKDIDYKIVWQEIRKILYLGGIEPVIEEIKAGKTEPYQTIETNMDKESMKERIRFSKLKMPSDTCVCGHTRRKHFKRRENCDHFFTELGLPCECEQFRQKYPWD